MSDEQASRPEDKYCYLEACKLDLEPLPVQGWILDIGGGGEGVIGQLMGAQVIAIDRNAEELEEAAPGPLKIVMDASDLKFLDGSFSAATAFFFLMYIRNEKILLKVLKEAYRVLQPGASMWIWDLLIPSRKNTEKEIYVVPVRINLPNGKRIKTGYGQRWPESQRDRSFYENIIVQAGFEIAFCEEDGHIIVMRVQKPDRIRIEQ